MKTKLIVSALFVATAFGAWRFSRTQTLEEVIVAPIEAETKTEVTASSPPRLPQDLEGAEAKLRQTNELMRKQLVPLLAKMPEEMKRTQDLIRFNDEMLRKLAEMKSSVQMGR